jgi:hypothetical protein
MLEIEPNTIAMMAASLEQCCRKLKNDTPEARNLSRTNLRNARGVEELGGVEE